MNAWRLKGRTIKGIKLNPFKDGKGGTAYDPVLTLDNGAKVQFVAQETEVGEYGIEIIYIPKREP